MNMEAYLVKKCPFCGHEIYTESYPEWYEGYCQNKRCFLYGMDFDFLDLEKWNTRPIEDALNARIAELEEEVTKGNELQDSYCDRIAKLEAYVAELEAEKRGEK